jgi:hypothetical protein
LVARVNLSPVCYLFRITNTPNFGKRCHSHCARLETQLPTSTARKKKEKKVKEREREREKEVKEIEREREREKLREGEREGAKDHMHIRL